MTSLKTILEQTLLGKTISVYTFPQIGGDVGYTLNPESTRTKCTKVDKVIVKLDINEGDGYTPSIYYIEFDEYSNGDLMIDITTELDLK